MDIGLKFLEVLKKQRNTFIRLADGTKRITNPFLYNLFEEESERLQMMIGKENKKLLIEQGIYIKNKI